MTPRAVVLTVPSAWLAGKLEFTYEDPFMMPCTTGIVVPWLVMGAKSTLVSLLFSGGVHQLLQGLLY